MSFAPPHHHLFIDAQLGALHLHADINLHAPWTVLFGPSGSGKSTLLRAMAGVQPSPSSNLRLDFGRHEPSGLGLPANVRGEDLLLQMRPLQGLPVQNRGIAYAPQAASLFPHLSVADNVAFGASVARRFHNGQAISEGELRSPGSSLSATLAAARELFELEPLWHRRPTELSGGEQQRVNLARAFARPHTRLFLLDEPFTGFDRSLRDRILPRLRDALAGRQTPVISVTHDIEEAFLLQAEVVRLEAGHVRGYGSAASVLATERQNLLRSLS